MIISDGLSSRREGCTNLGSLIACATEFCMGRLIFVGTKYGSIIVPLKGWKS
jgi:hypothetical protein